MKDEEMAEQYVKENDRVYYHSNGEPMFTREEDLKFAFLAGLKAQTRWHKVADGDLPNNARTVIIAYYAVDAKTVGTKEIKRTNEIVTEQCFYLENQGWTDTSDGEPYPYLNMEGVVIAWCELPIYKE